MDGEKAVVDPRHDLVVETPKAVKTAPPTFWRVIVTLTLNGVPLQLVRAGKGEALKPKGRLAKKAEAAEGAESDAEALAQAQQWLQNQPAPSTPAPPPPAAKAPKAAAPVKAGTDQLSQLRCWSNCERPVRERQHLHPESALLGQWHLV